MAIGGLAVIILGWFIQLLSKGNKINKNFIFVYCAGVAMLAIDGFQSGLPILAILNLVSLLAALFVVMKMEK